MWNLSLPAVYSWIVFVTYAEIVPQCQIHVHNQPSRPCGQVRRSRMCCYEPKNAVEVSSEQKEDSTFANVTFPVNVSDEDIFLVEGGDTCVPPHECWEVFLNGPNYRPAPDSGQAAMVILVFPKKGSYRHLGPGVEYQVSVTSSVTAGNITDRNEECDRLSRSPLIFGLHDRGGYLHLLDNGSEPLSRGNFPALKVTLFSASCRLDCGYATPLYTCGKDLPLDQFQRKLFNWTQPNSISLKIPREALVQKKTGVPLQFHCVLVELALQNWCKIRTTTLEWGECSMNPCVSGPVPLEASPGFVVLVSALLSVGVLFASMAVLLFCRRVARRTPPEDGSLGVPPLLEDLAKGLEAVHREQLQLPYVLLLYVDDLRGIKRLMLEFARTLEVAGVQKVLDPYHGSTLREVLEDKNEWLQEQLRQLSDGKLHVLLVATPAARDLDRGIDPKPNTHHELFKLALAGIRSDSSSNQYVTQISMDGEALRDVCPCHILSQNLNRDSLIHLLDDLLCERLPVTDKYVCQLRRLHESISKYRNTIKKAH